MTSGGRVPSPTRSEISRRSASGSRETRPTSLAESGRASRVRSRRAQAAPSRSGRIARTISTGISPVKCGDQSLGQAEGRGVGPVQIVNGEGDGTPAASPLSSAAKASITACCRDSADSAAMPRGVVDIRGQPEHHAQDRGDPLGSRQPDQGHQRGAHLSDESARPTACRRICRNGRKGSLVPYDRQVPSNHRRSASPAGTSNRDRSSRRKRVLPMPAGPVRKRVRGFFAKTAATVSTASASSRSRPTSREPPSPRHPAARALLARPGRGARAPAPPCPSGPAAAGPPSRRLRSRGDG